MKYVFTAAAALAIGVLGTLFWPAAETSFKLAPDATCTTVDTVTKCTVPIEMHAASVSVPCTYELDFELPLATGVKEATIVWNITSGGGNYQFANGGNAVTILNRSDAGLFTSPSQASPQSFQYTFTFPGPGDPTPGTTYDYNLSIVHIVSGQADAACAVKSQPPQPYPRIKNM